MIVSKTPLRISFQGGGSDLPAYYEQAAEYGLVVSTTIDREIAIAVSKCEPSHCRVVYSEMEVVSDSSQIKHDRVREALKIFDINSNIEICSFSDISTKGTGLGSSSTFTVGLVKALSILKDIRLPRHVIANIACLIEIDYCKEPIGKQDQYAAAYGGLNAIHFDPSGVEVEPIRTNINDLQNRLIMFSTGITRRTSDILSKQVENLKQESTIETTSRMVELARRSIDYLNDQRLDDFGQLLHEGWVLKKSLVDNISNDCINEMYELALKNGALGGKILGAGGGGYMLLYVPEQYKFKLIREMNKAGYKQFEFKFSNQGTQGHVL